MSILKKIKDKTGTIHDLGDSRVDAFETELSGAEHNVPYSPAVLAKTNAIESSVSSHIGNKANPHEVTKAQIGLANVENKSSTQIRSELTKENVTNALGYTPIDESRIGAANGVASLDASGRIPASQIPGGFDNIEEYDNLAAFPTTGEEGKIYVAKDTNLTYRWTGSQYVEISPSLALGETATTAYRGDRGKVAYDHSQVSGNSTIHHTHANKELLDTYTQTEADLANAVAKVHEHGNKAVLEGITATDVSNWNSKQNSLPTRGTASSTYAINISGKSTSANNWHGSIYGIAKSTKTKRYVYIGRKMRSEYGCLIGILTVCSHTDSKEVYVISSGWSKGNFGSDAYVQRISSGGAAAPINICLYNHEITENDTVYSELWCYIPTTSGEVDFIFRTLFNFKGMMTLAASVVNRAESEFTGTLTKCVNSNSRNISYSPTNTAVGSASVPVYVTSSGAVTACTDDFVHDGDVTSTYSSTGTAPVNGKAVAAAIGGLDVSSVGGDGKYISAISETDGKISATATTMDTTPTVGSTNPVTSEGIKTALEVLQSNIDTADSKGIVINEIGGENVICFE